jgi:hypothetical protein
MNFLGEQEELEIPNPIEGDLTITGDLKVDGSIEAKTGTFDDLMFYQVVREQLIQY